MYSFPANKKVFFFVLFCLLFFSLFVFCFSKVLNRNKFSAFFHPKNVLSSRQLSPPLAHITSPPSKSFSNFALQKSDVREASVNLHTKKAGQQNNNFIVTRNAKEKEEGEESEDIASPIPRPPLIKDPDTLVVKGILGRNIEIPNKKNIKSVVDLKNAIQNLHGIHREEQVIIQNNKVLKDDEVFPGTYALDDGPIYLTSKLRGGISLKVKTMGGKTVEIDKLDEQDTIETLKERIYKKEGVSPEEQRLVFKGKQMQNDRTLKDYNLQEGSELHLVLKLRGG